MCGITGYIGKDNSVPVLVEGLKRLEYRGYDSAGVAVHSSSGIQTVKEVGRIEILERSIESNQLCGCCGIGHTRWATHGEPSAANAHPHADNASRVFVVHNGIIENFSELRHELIEKGHTFASETDTEVIPHLIASFLDQGNSPAEAIRSACTGMQGAYALAVLFADEPDTLYAVREGSPLVIGIGPDAHYVASDTHAFPAEVTQIIYLEDGILARMKTDDMTTVDSEGNSVTPILHDRHELDDKADKAGFETFMLKEIYEQPRILRALLSHYRNQDDGTLQLNDLDLERLTACKRIYIVSCGTAYYAGAYGRLLLEHLTPLPTEIDLGSEFRYRNPSLEKDTLIIAVSQSGETADTLASIRLAKEKGCPVLSICNVPGSSLVRESDMSLFTMAGPEIGVASTKAFTAQLMTFALLALKLGVLHKSLSTDDIEQHLHELYSIPDLIHYVIDRSPEIRSVADKHCDGPSALYIGRRFNFPTALEGALKNKEISYQHAEGYAAGEMKHGPIALIHKYMPVICICTKTGDEVYDKMLSNMREVEARQGRIIAVANDGDDLVSSFAEDILYVPYVREVYSPMINVVALQLFAYYTAQARGTDIDKPRNLAKSVTVE